MTSLGVAVAPEASLPLPVIVAFCSVAGNARAHFGTGKRYFRVFVDLGLVEIVATVALPMSPIVKPALRSCVATKRAAPLTPLPFFTSTRNVEGMIAASAIASGEAAGVGGATSMSLHHLRLSGIIGNEVVAVGKHHVAGVRDLSEVQILLRHAGKYERERRAFRYR